MTGPLDALALVQGDEAMVGKAKDCPTESFVYVLGSSGKNTCLTYVYGIESPGLTSSLALVEYVRDMAAPP